MDEARLAEIDQELEALGEPETDVGSLIAEFAGREVSETDALLEELADGKIEVDLPPLPEAPEPLEPLPELGRESTSISQPPVEAAPTDEVAAVPAETTIDQPESATEEFEAVSLDEPVAEEPEFDLPPPSVTPEALESDENLLGSGLEDLGKSDVPEPLSASLAAFIDPPDSEAPSNAPSAAPVDAPPSPDDIPPNPRLPELDGSGFDDDDDERTGLFSQEDIDAIRASSPPPPRSAPPPASASVVASVPPPVPDAPPAASVAPPPPIPAASVAPASIDDEELEILDDDDFELMIEEDGIDAVDEAMDDVIDELIDDSIDEPAAFEDDTAASDEPVIQEPEVETPAAAADGEEGEGEEGEDGEKKGFFKKLFG